MIKSIFSVDMAIIQANLYKAVFSLQRKEMFEPIMGVKRIYFIGASLCMDFNNDVIVLNHREELVGFFSGGIRRLLPIDCMRLLEGLMDMCEIVHTPKWVTKRELVS